ncbi:MAG: CHAT domain-containing protein [Bacteroidetes bacterium]|nr:MAG: CHAT domain-containing protein [Bacteroidota bacterium]
MIRLSFVLVLQTFALAAFPQTSLFQHYFPQEADKSLWSETLLLDKENIFMPEIADSLLHISWQRLAENSEPRANLMVATLLADYYASKGRNPQKGREILLESGDIFSQNNDTLHIAWVFRYSMMAYNSVYTRNAGGIASNFEKAYNVLLALDNNHSLIPPLQYNLMQAFFQVRKLVEGFDYFYPLIEYAEKNEDWFFLINAYLGAGNIIKFYNPGLGRQFLQYSLFLAQKYNVSRHLNDPFFFISLGSVNTAVDNHLQAMELYKKGLGVLRQNTPQNKPLEGNLLYYIGVSYGNLGKYNQAIAYLDSAATLEKELAGKSRSWYRTMGLKGKNLNLAGSYREALEVNREVFSFFESTSAQYNNYYFQNSIQELMKTYTGLGEWEKALNLGQQAIYSFFGMETPDDPFVLPDLQQHISPDKNYLEPELAIYLKIETMAQMAQKNTEKEMIRHMLDHFDAATHITDKHASVVANAETLAALSARFKQNANLLLDALAALQADQSQMQRAYRLVARSKAYLLLTENTRNQLYGASAQPNLNSDPKALKTDLASRLLSLSPDEDADEWEYLNRELLFLEKDNFVAGIRNPFEPQPLINQMHLLSDHQSVHQNLSDNEVVIDFYISEKNIHTFVITRESFQFLPQPLPDNFNNLTTNLFRHIRTGNQSQTNVVAATMGQFLFEGIEMEAENKDHLIVIPDERLHTIPFDILEIQNHPLSDKMAVSYRYNSHLYRKTNLSEKPAAESFFALAPVFDNDQPLSATEASAVAMEEEYRDMIREGQYLVPLPATLEEVKQLTEMFANAGVNTKSLQRLEATRENFKNLAGSFDIIHLATHGFSNSLEPEKSGLALFEADDSYHGQGHHTTRLLMLGELSRLTLNSDLVVLSACKSGYGTIQRGEGIMGISRGFIAAGANNVVASLWKVHDQKTKEFMVTFYEYIIQGYNYHEALRLTKLDKQLEGWLTADWAGFILIGA